MGEPKETLLPCPFCKIEIDKTLHPVDSKLWFKKGNDVGYHAVNKCFLSGRIIDDFKAWNNRVRPQLDEGKIKDIIIKDIVGKSAMDNWGVKSLEGDGFLETHNIAKNRFTRLVETIIKSDIWKDST